MGWISPTSDTANGWTDSGLAWDDDTLTAATHSTPAGWGPYLELHHAELQCTKVQGWWGIVNTQVTDIEIDVYYSGAYNNIYSGAIVTGSFQEYEIGSEQAVTAMTGGSPPTENTGKYHYDFQTSDISRGYYTAKYIATDGTRITIEKDTFTLE